MTRAANLTDEAIAKLPADMDQGVYYGWSQIGGGAVHKSVMSIGWNPFYKNKTRSAEVHIMHPFEAEFYGSEIRVVVLGRLRGEKDFDSLGPSPSPVYTMQFSLPTHAIVCCASRPPGTCRCCSVCV